MNITLFASYCGLLFTIMFTINIKMRVLIHTWDAGIWSNVLIIVAWLGGHSFLQKDEFITTETEPGLATMRLDVFKMSDC